MNQVTQILDEAVRTQLSQNNLEIAGIVPIPRTGNRLVRLKAIEEFIDEFVDELQEMGQTSGSSYLIQIKPKGHTPPAVETLPSTEEGHPPEKSDEIYLPTGKLNVSFLQRNAEILFQSGEYALARKIYRTILLNAEFTPVIQEAFYWIGRCFEAEKKPQEAIMNYRESIAYRSDLETYQHLAALLSRESRWDEAAQTLERALNFCPAADGIRQELGNLYLKTKRIPEAKKQFREILVSNPKNHLALTGLATCQMLEKDFNSAHATLTESLELDLNQAQAIYSLVKCAHEIKSYATACRLLEKYLDLGKSNRNATLLYSLAGLQFLLGRIENARSTANHVLIIQANHTGARELLKLTENFYQGG